LAKESNWRWNVFELGLAPHLVQLAARINAGIYTGFYVVNTPNGIGTVSAWLPASSGDVNGFTTNTGRPMVGPFPYGFSVDPD